MIPTREQTLIAATGSWDRSVRPNEVAGLVSRVQPANLLYLGDEFEEVTFALTVFGIFGAPSSASLGAKFQFLQSDAAAGAQYTTHRWYDLDEVAVAHNIVEGVGWSGPGQTPPTDGGYGVIATQASSGYPITVQRTVRNFGRSVRVALDSQFSSQSGTGWDVQLTMTGKRRA